MKQTIIFVLFMFTLKLSVCLNSITDQQACRRGEVFQSCGTACETTCANIHNPPRYCTYQCISKCFCRQGLIRNFNGVCVPPTLCGRRRG
ncbi:chymotrypsin inhibitor-like protein [Leptotrombidium deliense]|uniref:Chymotrypsin inhibitor-like protein n=1 Tax=Leptotrombidium deliense TaxID=299467 RepID=A0A443S959_9ACAR|nr:chymotrypsin inhibitor-like protein [Leptotrombidium deliense]